MVYSVYNWTLAGLGTILWLLGILIGISIGRDCGERKMLEFIIKSDEWLHIPKLSKISSHHKDDK